MLSCATLDTAVVGMPQVNPAREIPSASTAAWPKRGDGGGGGGGGPLAVAERSSVLADRSVGGSKQEQGTSARGGAGGGGGTLRENVDAVGKRPPRELRDGVKDEAATEKSAVTADRERQRRRRGGDNDGGGDGGGGGGRDNKNGKVTGMGHLRPFFIDLREEVNKTGRF